MTPEPGPWKRRSERLIIAIPLYVSSLNPTGRFAEVCETISVNNHGCVIRFPKKVDTGEAVRLDIPHTNRRAQARVVRAEKADPNRDVWYLALELDSAENFWGLRFPPVDWTPATEAAVGSVAGAPEGSPVRPPNQTSAGGEVGRNVARSLQEALEEVQQTKSRLEALWQRANQTIDTRVAAAVSERTGQIEAQLEQRWKQWLEKEVQPLETAKRPAELQSAAQHLEQQLPQLAADIATGVTGRLMEVWNQGREDLLRSLNARLEEIRAVEKSVRELGARSASSAAGESTAESLRTQLVKLLGEQLARAQQQFDEEAASTRLRHLREYDEQLHKRTVQSVEQWVKVATAVEQRSQHWSEQIPLQDAHIQELEERIRTVGETLTRTVESETGRFSRLLEQRLLEATGHLKGQTQFALEMAHSFAEDYRRRAEKEIEAALSRELAAAGQQVSELEARLHTLRTEAEASLRAASQVILQEVTADLDVHLRDVGLDYARTLHNKTSEILEAMATVVRERLEQSDLPHERGPGGERK